MDRPGHVWISGGVPTGRAAAAARFAPDATYDCHRRHRGPYTGTGSMLRHLVPALDPDLVGAHASAVVLAAPELAALLGPLPGTLTSTAPARERTRWYPKARTRRIALGVIDMLRTCVVSPLTLHFAAVDHADATDLEFLALALTRLDPARIRLVLSATGEPRPDIEEGSGLTGVIAERCVAVVSTGPGPEAWVPGTARDFVDSDGTTENLAAEAAYRQLDPAERARLHDARAEALIATGEVSFRLGAIPYHRSLGSSPEAARVAHRSAMVHCTNEAFYDAGLEHGDRVLALTDRAADPAGYHLTQMNRANLQFLMYRADEAESIFYEVLAGTVDPEEHAATTYGMAMLYTRVYGPDRKDHHRALSWINIAIALAGQLPDPADRAFHSAFMQNGKALVCMHLGRLDEALALVDQALARLDGSVGPDSHRLHRSVLHHNRGQLYAALGRAAEAITEFDHVIGVDPHYPEFRFDRGNLLVKMGRHTEALADYEAAARMGPPYPELFHNIGDVRATLGDPDGAVAAFRRAVDLDPDQLDSRISLTTMLVHAGQAGAAAAETRAGLALRPDEPRLHCTLALALLALDDPDGAVRACDRALELAPGLFEALVNRAVAHHAAGRPDASVADLTAALDLRPGDADALFNRAYAAESVGRFDAAVEDYTAVLATDPPDRADVLFRRGRCHFAAGRVGDAERDFASCGPDAYTDEIRELVAAGPLALRVDHQAV